MHKKLYLGMPGSGKTTTLLKILEQELQHTPPHKIAYVSFTRKAIHEAQERAFKQLGVSKQQMPFFKTLHALAFSAMGISRDDVLSDEHLKLLSQRLGIDLLDTSCPFQPLALYNLSRVKNVKFYDIWQKTHLIHTKTYAEILHIVEAYKYFKEKECLMDFTDMIIQYNKKGSPLPVKVAMVDEAQDLSTVQWNMLQRAFANVDRLILAGDDDQCIYAWSGADRKKFLKFEGEKIILNTSYRCPKAVADFANRISGRIKQRYSKQLLGTDKPGTVQIMHDISTQSHLLNNGQEWLILVRNRTDLAALKRLLIHNRLAFSIDGKPYGARKQVDAILGYRDLCAGKAVSGSTAKNISDCAGMKNTHFDVDDVYNSVDILKTNDLPQDFRNILVAIFSTHLAYYFESIKNNQDLLNPKIHLTTIHGSKGAECENVVLSCDQSILTYKSMQHYPDSEHRVFYVGATRAKSNLFLLQASKQRHYQMPEIGR